MIRHCPSSGRLHEYSYFLILASHKFNDQLLNPNVLAELVISWNCMWMGLGQLNLAMCMLVCANVNFVNYV